jgi:putative DNA methylase
MTMSQNNNPRLIETDRFPFEFVSQLAERESWRKEVHRPIYHVHKWWAKRLGSVFRGILLGTILPDGRDLGKEFYQTHDFADVTVFDPFMGSGTTIGEAHKLGLTAIGRDINPVAVQSVRTALGPMHQSRLEDAFKRLSHDVGKGIRTLYRSKDANGRPCDVLYFFWVMQVHCVECHRPIDLFPSWIIAGNAYPNRKPEVQILCPSCGDIFAGLHGDNAATCPKCGTDFDPQHGPVKGANATCRHCRRTQTILGSIVAGGARPEFRLYGKLVLTQHGAKQYLPAAPDDQAAYRDCTTLLDQGVAHGDIRLPSLALEHGSNTRQAMSYAFRSWRDFFNDRQLLALGWLHAAIARVPDPPARAALQTLFSGVLEFNNMFASYKGEGTGAVRHMFSHHILKPERTPIEANVWGTSKSSGAFSNLFRSRLLRAIEYRNAPTEVNATAAAKGRICALPFTGELDDRWPIDGRFARRAIYLSCDDSSRTGLSDRSIDLVVTDPPFFDNVHYSELADFFHAWQQLTPDGGTSGRATTRSPFEVQDADVDNFAAKLCGVFRECRRVLKDAGLLVFTYHHSREEGWTALAEAVLAAGFAAVNSQPVKAEMSVATPKSQAKDPIQLDIVIVCRKANTLPKERPTVTQALESAKAKLTRLHQAGFSLSRNDRRIVMFGQLLTTLTIPAEAAKFSAHADSLLDSPAPAGPIATRPKQLSLFDTA